MLAGFAALSLILGWYTAIARQYDSEIAAIDKLNKSTNGYVATLREGEPLLCGTGVIGRATLRWQGPQWLRNPLIWCDASILYRIEDLDLGWEHYDDSIIPELAVFTSLKRIDLLDTKITWEDRERIAEMFPLATIQWRLATVRTADDPFR